MRGLRVFLQDLRKTQHVPPFSKPSKAMDGLREQHGCDMRVLKKEDRAEFFVSPVLFSRVGIGLFFIMGAAFAEPTQDSNVIFRQQVMNYVRAVSQDMLLRRPLSDGAALDRRWNASYQVPNWSIEVQRYCKGHRVGIGAGRGSRLSQALQVAVRAALKSKDARKAHPHKGDHCRWKLVFDYEPYRQYAFVEFGRQTAELTGNRVAIRVVDKVLLEKQAKASRAYLLRVMHPIYHGFYKFYFPEKNAHQTQLRTIYSASSLYALLKLNALYPDPQVTALVSPIASFVLEQQVKGGAHQGAFYYGYHPQLKKQNRLLMVGTTSKVIFTLLLLHAQDPHDARYLDAAKWAGDWLIQRVNEKGEVTPKISLKNGQWQVSGKQSFLYSGQVLSALSRLYGVTHDPHFKEVASRIVHRFEAELKHQGWLLADGYRPSNSISSSWVLMSFIDYADAVPEAGLQQTISNLSQFLVSRQSLTSYDIYTYGRYWDATTSSGNGWINEVMGRAYDYCMKSGSNQCAQYREAMIRTSRWLIQNAYSKANTFDVKRPRRAMGGLMMNATSDAVRTDAVCHAMNSLTDLLQVLSTHPEPLLSVSAQPLDEILPMLRAGRSLGTAIAFKRSIYAQKI